MDAELDEFKRRIDLREYAARLGYELNRRESSRCSSIMETKADKIVIKRNANLHYVYFSVRDDADNGTLIDFAQRRKHLNLGQLRKELRPWVGRAPSPLPLFSKLESSAKDRQAVERAYSRMKIAAGHPYLEKERKIPPPLLGSPRFAGRIRIDDRGAAVFPHFDEYGLCGYELKNKDFTGFARGGEKGLWESHDQDDDMAIVFAESAIDALSHAGLFPNTTTRYRSIGGAVNDRQPGLIKTSLADLPKNVVVIAAMDNDDAGHKLVVMIETCFAAIARPDLTFRSDLPPIKGEDWNEVLKACALPAPNFFPIALP